MEAKAGVAEVRQYGSRKRGEDREVRGEGTEPERRKKTHARHMRILIELIRRKGKNQLEKNVKKRRDIETQRRSLRTGNQGRRDQRIAGKARDRK